MPYILICKAIVKSTLNCLRKPHTLVIRTESQHKFFQQRQNIDVAMGQICGKSFLAAQGHYVHTKNICQDNKSTILLAENRQTSSSKWTCHVNILFFVTDKFKKGEVKLAFCPTKNILGDFFTKPLQGALFVCMQEKILNLPASTSTHVHRSLLEVSRWLELTSQQTNIKVPEDPGCKWNTPTNEVDKTGTKENDPCSEATKCLTSVFDSSFVPQDIENIKLILLR